jgi:hypothetical protein
METSPKIRQEIDMRARLAVIANRYGMVPNSFFHAFSWLFGCPYCETGWRFLALLDSGKITEHEAIDLISQVLIAKGQKDEVGLQRLKGKLEGLRLSSK